MSESRQIYVRVLGLFGVTAVIVGGLFTVTRFFPRVALPVASAQERYDASLYADLRWRNIGPFRGGRVNAVSGVAGQPDTYYFGSVGGGVWKSTNSGRTWTPIFDSQPVASIGGIGVAPSDPNIVYVGTGEADMR